MPAWLIRLLFGNILARLDAIEGRLEQMGNDLHALDAVLETLAADVAALKAAVEALIAAIPPGDFSSEIAQVQDAFASIEQTTAEAVAATPGPTGPTGPTG
jgi:hypothetical protein